MRARIEHHYHHPHHPHHQDSSSATQHYSLHIHIEPHGEAEGARRPAATSSSSTCAAGRSKRARSDDQRAPETPQGTVPGSRAPTGGCCCCCYLAGRTRPAARGRARERGGGAWIWQDGATDAERDVAGSLWGWRNWCWGGDGIRLVVYFLSILSHPPFHPRRILSVGLSVCRSVLIVQALCWEHWREVS